MLIQFGLKQKKNTAYGHSLYQLEFMGSGPHLWDVFLSYGKISLILCLAVDLGFSFGSFFLKAKMH